MTSHCVTHTCVSSYRTAFRFSKASQERGWVLLFDPEERLESPSARREKLDIAIREVRRSSDTEDIVSLNDSLGIITDFFFLEGVSSPLQFAHSFVRSSWYYSQEQLPQLLGSILQ